MRGTDSTDRTRRPGRPVVERLRTALDGLPPGPDALAGATPRDERDELLTLSEIHALWTAPLQVTAGRERFQTHPVVIALKHRLEEAFLGRLEQRCGPAPEIAPGDAVPEDAVAEMRRIAVADLVPPVYDWLAEDATWDELVDFLALEGGPDAGFDDLVALAQVGLRGIPKVALALNYWDEMGRGEPGDVHTVLHDELVAATEMPRPDPATVPVSALERAVMGGVLATNRWLQPEMLGALGLIELQAGPRCRAVLKALRRLDAPTGAFPFYEEHAVADPRHGKDWLDRVVAPLAAEQPGWATRMVQGARWRQDVNRRFFGDLYDRFVPVPARAAS